MEERGRRSRLIWVLERYAWSWPHTQTEWAELHDDARCAVRCLVRQMVEAQEYWV